MWRGTAVALVALASAASTGWRADPRAIGAGPAAAAAEASTASTARMGCTQGPGSHACRRPTPEPRALPGRLVVKLRGEFREPLDLAHAAGVRLAEVASAGGAELDRAIAEFGVRSIEPVFRSLLAGGAGRIGAGAGADRRRRVRAAFDRTREAFPRRAPRADLGAEPPDLTRVFLLELPPDADLREAARAFAAIPAVEHAVPLRTATVDALPDDPFLSASGSWGQPYDDLWALKAIRAPEAWVTSIGAGTVVAVVDTGLDLAHPDIAANVWSKPAELSGLPGVDDDQNGLVDDVTGWDFVNGTATPGDDHGHGTHVAGTIAAVGNNAIGVIGVAHGARVMPLKALGADGTGALTDLANAIVYAALNGADVINNSWACAGGCEDPSVADAIALARSLGCVVVVAAGNDGADVRKTFPANLPGVLTVAATQADDAPSSFSNHGWLIDLAAPGGGSGGLFPANDILSLRAAGTGPPWLLVGTDYVRYEGTSMAAPHVAGAAALVLSANPSLTVAQVESVLRHSASDQVGDPPDVAGYDPRLGWGRLDAAGAVALAALPPDDPPILKVVAPALAFALPSSDCGGSRSLPFTPFNLGGDDLRWAASAPGWAEVTPATGGSSESGWVTATIAEARSGTLALDVDGAPGGRVELPLTLRIAAGLRIRECEASPSRATSSQSWDPVWSGGAKASPGIPDGEGGAIYVWVDWRSGAPDLYAQRFDSEGRPVWALDGVSVTSSIDVKTQPAIATDGAGGAIIAYVEGPGSELWSGRVRAQRVDAAGGRRWGDEGVWLNQADGGQELPGIASDGAGGAVVAWIDRRTRVGNVYVQRIAWDGRPIWPEGGIPVSGQASFQYEPSVAADGAGGAFIAWGDAREPFLAVYAQRMGADGLPRWLEGGVRVAAQPARGAVIVSDGADGAYVAWKDLRAVWLEEPNGQRSDIYAARLDSEGHPLWADGGVPVTEGAPASTCKIEPGLEPSEVTLAPDGSGGLLFAWMDGRSGDGWDVYAQRLGRDGERRWGTAGVPVVEASGDQLAPVVVADGSDGALFAWGDLRAGQSEIFVQRLGPHGDRLLPSEGVWLESRAGDQTHPFIVPLGGGGRFQITWDDEAGEAGADMAGMVVDFGAGPPGPPAPPEPSRPSILGLAGCGCGTGAEAAPLGLLLVGLTARRRRRCGVPVEAK